MTDEEHAQSLRDMTGSSAPTALAGLVSLLANRLLMQTDDGTDLTFTVDDLKQMLAQHGTSQLMIIYENMPMPRIRIRRLTQEQARQLAAVATVARQWTGLFS
jgi:hypothetical protein